MIIVLVVLFWCFWCAKDYNVVTVYWNIVWWSCETISINWLLFSPLPKLGQLSGCDVSWPRECCYQKSEQFSLAYDLHRPTLHLHTFLLPTVQVASAQLQIVDCHVSCHHHQRAARGHSLHLANNNQTTLICIHNMQYTGRIHACLFNEVTGHIPPDITPQGQSPPFSGKAG